MWAMESGHLLWALLFMQSLWPQLTDGATRVYYLGIRDVQWNYAPKGKNVITNQPLDSDIVASSFLKSDKNRIGGNYKKTIYKEYKDDSYTDEVAQPAWLGFLGPVLKAEVGDVILIHLKNFATRPYTIHPHGVFYEKDSEGSLYPDGSSGPLKADDSVPPGGSHIYNWTIPEGHAPTDADPACLTWIYHSHVDAPRDIATGLIGPLITCKRGALGRNSAPQRQDVDHEFFLLFSVIDENLSWHLDENIATYCSDPASVDKEDETFQESNRMHAINGFVFGNLPELNMCAQKRVAWHLFGMGNEVDVHTAFFHGQMLTTRGHRTDVAHIFPATFVTAEMVPWEPGTWLVSCQVNSHFRDGMQALYKVKSCSATPPVDLLTGKVRQYFIEAHEIQWDYGPMGHDGSTGKSLREPGSDSDKFFQKSSSRIGGTYWKVRYEAFQDETFQEKMQLEEDRHLGILGPVIRAEVGDIIQVVFYNRASKPFSMQPHGVFYEKDYEGAVYNDGSSHPGLVAKPFEKVTYRWTVPPHAGPTAQDPACLTWMYFSAADPIRDTNSGLVGPLLVCRAGALGTDGKQKGVDKEFFLLFTVLDENKSWYSNANQATAMLDFRLLSEDIEGFQDSNRMHAINGFLFSNLPRLEMCKGDTVAWHLLGLGTETDVHGVMFEGNTVQLQGMRKGAAMLFPHTFVMAIMQPDNLGTFEIYCQAGSHREAGMKAIYNVSQCPGRQATPRQRYQAARIYYIMAEEVEWDYCPDRSWELEWHNQSEKDSYGHIFLSNKDGLLGSRYKKAVFREYTDGTFRIRQPRTGPEEHLGILGPLIKAEVGDILTVVFKNNASRPYSVHAHGVLESSTGWPLAAEPGEVLTYQWNIPERSGPGPNDSACVSWIYYSAVDPIKDMYSGLVGPLAICRKGILQPHGGRSDMDREFALLFLIFDENQSWYLEENVATHGSQDPGNVNLQDETFLESNKMHAINGKLYANLRGLTMYQGERVAWYMLAMGQDVDLHTIHFHAESFLYRNGENYRADVVDLFPGTFEVVEMVASNPGTWLMHCHVTDHVHAGMETLFTVLSQTEHLSTITTITKETEKAVTPRDIEEGNVNMLGMPIPIKNVEMLASVLVAICITFLLIALALGGVVWYQHRQRKLRRNRRSILDDSFKLLSLKQ
ncbi:hephaestin isoform X1 [Saimiri boliviensis]|uniref:Hephaestin n=1 Tax=Saimiri boliviensis boliviensis TaxID=39432 RepID=A0A2K6SM82_SAIBB|nr:hephaestin isoform X1 [Saimiri boliviensis boliviensis]XP_039331516.1 hephaestin isoform X1 [Saimiri boliviensis boliviensis]